MSVDLQNLTDIVQRNCHIADAQHARDYSMCVYLLKMREYYRWEKGFSFGTPIPGDEVGNWVTERERYWERVENEEYSPIAINGHKHAPFDAETINRSLNPAGLIYSAGYGRFNAPHFFLADLDRTEHHNGYTILVAGKEHARDLTSPPAMSLGNTIFIRRESLRRMLWEKVEEWRWRRMDNPLGRALSYYDFDTDLDAGLDNMTEREIGTMILHEIGEVRAGRLLGQTWQDMLASISHTRAELMVRAVRDHLADCLVTLPAMLREANPAALHFYFANMRAMRKELFPAMLDAYRHWSDNGDMASLDTQIRRGESHWTRTAQEILDLHRKHGDDSTQPIETLIDNRRL